jgi:putative membrane protein
MMLAVILGLWRLSYALDYYLSSLWMQLKLLGVVCLLAYHVQCGRYVARINGGDDNKSHVFYRFFNEVPVLFLFAIVLLVYVRPA